MPTGASLGVNSSKQSVCRQHILSIQYIPLCTEMVAMPFVLGARAPTIDT